MGLFDVDTTLSIKCFFSGFTIILFCLFLILKNEQILLLPLNKIWFKFGIFLGKIISPLVMGIIFFVVVLL